MTTYSSRLRRLLAIAGSTLLALVLLTLVPDRAAAQSVGGDVVSCGGRDEVPCPVFSVFTAENGGQCDRGLNLNLFANKCVNGDRRLGPGAAFRSSWLGRAMRSQFEDLNRDTILRSLPTRIGAHNAYNNAADGYAFANQVYSLTEQLDAGYRDLELDVHASMNSQSRTGKYPKVCHGNQTHTGCIATDRWFANALKEIRDWMRESGHGDAVLLIGIEGYVDDEYDMAIVDKAIEEYLVKPAGIGVYTPADHAANKERWPERSSMVAAGTRIVISMSNRRSKYAFEGAEPFETTNIASKPGNIPIDYFTDRNGCKDNNGKPIELWSVYSDDLAGAAPDGSLAVTLGDVEDLARCNAGVVRVDNLIYPNFDARLEGVIWSWAKNEPAVNSRGKAARMNTSTGRWEAHSQTEHAKYLCRTGTGTGWLGTTASGPWASGFTACQNAGGTFAVPMNGKENKAASDTVKSLGTVWINFVPEGSRDLWAVGEKFAPAIAVSPKNADGSVNAFSPVVFSAAVPATQEVQSYLWKFNDGSTSTDASPQRTFTKRGSYTISLTATEINGATATVSRTVVVEDLDDPAFGFPLTNPDSTTEGAATEFRARGRATAHPSTVTASCGPEARVQSQQLVQLKDGDFPEYKITCTWKGGNWAGPQTGTVTIIATNVRTYAYSDSIPVNNTPAVLTAPANVTIPLGRVLDVFTPIQDALDDVVSLTISWGDGQSSVRQVFTPGFWLGHRYAQPSPAGSPYTVSVTASDGSEPASTGSFSVTVTGTPDLAAPALTVPAPIAVDGFSSRGARASFTVNGRDAIWPADTIQVGCTSTTFEFGLDGEGAITVGPEGQTLRYSGVAPIGQHIVKCTTGDPSGNVATASFTIAVRDLRRVIVTPQYANPDHRWRLGGASDVFDSGLNFMHAHGRYSAKGVTDATRTTCRGDEPVLNLDPTGTGSGSYINLGPAVAQFGTFDFSIAMWFKTAAANATVLSSRKGFSTNYNQSYVEVALDRGQLFATVGQSNGGNAVLSGPSGVNDDKWHHVTLRRRGSSLALFLDGAPAGASNPGVVLNVADAGELWVGATPVREGNDLIGSVDDLQVFSFRALDDAEIAAIYGSLADANGDGACDAALVDLDWTFEEATTPAGVEVWYGPALVEPIDLSLGPRYNAECSFASGAPAPLGTVFPIGVTTVNCVDPLADDPDVRASFTVRVHAQAKPTVTVPPFIVKEATSRDGLIVEYEASAVDAKDGAIVPVCTPASGTRFDFNGPSVPTIVTCTATDSDGNSAAASFGVFVVDGPPAIAAHEDVVAEAAGPGGTAVPYTPPATSDALDGTGIALCAPGPNSTFPLGSTTVTCRASDSGGRQATETHFTVLVRDTKAPQVTVPADITVEAGQGGVAAVTFSTSASDAVTTGLTPACSPSSGHPFALGTTKVTCSAEDASHNVGSASFNVIVRDTTAPVLLGHADVVADAAGPQGAVVTYDPPATTDSVDGAGTGVCEPASGTTFGLGRTTVTCRARDAAGNESDPSSFAVIVRDTTPPAVMVPPDATIEATEKGGARPAFNPSAADAVSGASPASCTPASGSHFPLGATKVRCTAADAAGNTGDASFTITVRDTRVPSFVFVPAAVTMVQTTAAGAFYTPQAATAADVADPAPVVTIMGVPAGNVFPVGTTTLTYVATDASGNHDSARTTVTVVHNTPVGAGGSVRASDSTLVTFASVDTPGFTASVAIDPASASPLPPAFVSALLAYEVSTTAVVTAPIAVCFTVPAVIDRATFDTLRVLHGENGVFVDRTILPPASLAPDFAARTLCAQTASLSPFVIAVRDVTPPAVTCGSPDGLWHGRDVSISCTATDGGAGLEVADATFLLSTNVPANTEIANAATDSRTVCDRAGNCTAVTSIGGNKVDKKAPAIVVTRSPGANAAGWSNTNVVATFTAADGGSGVNGPEMLAVPFTAEGANQSATRTFTDLAGNTATAAIDGISIDRTAPSVYLQIEPSTKTVQLYGRDALSGVAAGPIAPLSVEGKNTELRTYRLTDRAGNTLLLVAQVKLSGSQLSVEVAGVPENSMKIEWSLDKDGTIKQLQQKLTAGGTHVSAHYDSKKNVTEIAGEPGSKITRPGLVPLRLVLDSGRLVIEY